MKYTKGWLWSLLLLSTLAWFWYIAWGKLDPDFGWHLRTGQLILSGHFPYTDPFSFTMPSYPYVDHAWLTDVFLAWAFPSLGFVGVSFIFAALAVIALVFSARGRFSLELLFPWFMVISVLTPRFGIRTQIADWLMWATVWFILAQDRTYYRWRWLLPLLVGLWVNLHGGFIIGLLAISWRVFSVLIIRRRWDGRGILIVILSLLATLLTPYGLSLWREVIMTVWGNNMRSTIIEWMPFYTYLEMGFLLPVPLAALLIWRYRTRYPLWKIIWLIALFIAALASLRHASLFGLTLIAEIVFGLDLLRQQVNILPQGPFRYRMFLLILVFIAAVTTSIEMSANIRCVASGCLKQRYYPEAGLKYLSSRPSTTRLLTLYSWGGYQLLKLPQWSTFIDGRMAIWRRSSAPLGESPNAYNDYLDLTEGRDPEPLLRKYRVDLILWPAPATPSANLFSYLENRLTKLGWFTPPKRTGLSQTITKLGWRPIYSDSVSVVYAPPPEW